MIQKGFTLIELIIVIGVIGVLATAVGLNIYTGSVKHGRDTKRIRDMNAIQTAMEECYTLLQQQYPTSVPFGSPLTCASQSLLNPVPRDPRYPQATPYQTSSATATSYCACAYLEVKPPNSNDVNCTYTGITPPAGGGGFYCVKNAQ